MKSSDLKNFPYDMWRDEQGRFFIKVRKTKEVTEVDIDVFRSIRNEKMNMYRELKGCPVYGKKNGKSVKLGYTKPKSMNINENEETGLDWVVDKKNLEDELTTKINIEEFKCNLTKKQLEIFENCLLLKRNVSDYAIEKNVSKQSIYDSINLIRKKFKKFFM